MIKGVEKGKQRIWKKLSLVVLSVAVLSLFGCGGSSTENETANETIPVSERIDALSLLRDEVTREEFFDFYNFKASKGKSTYYQGSGGNVQLDETGNIQYVSAVFSGTIPLAGVYADGSQTLEQADQQLQKAGFKATKLAEVEEDEVLYIERSPGDESITIDLSVDEDNSVVSYSAHYISHDEAIELGAYYPEINNPITQSDGQMEVTIKAAYELKAIGGSEPLNDAIYVVVEYNVKNVSNEPIEDKPFIHLISPDGVEYQHDVGATTSALVFGGVETDEKAISNLNPGLSMNGASVFEVSKAELQNPGWKIKVQKQNLGEMFLGSEGSVMLFDFENTYGMTRRSQANESSSESDSDKKDNSSNYLEETTNNSINEERVYSLTDKDVFSTYNNAVSWSNLDGYYLIPIMEGEIKTIYFCSENDISNYAQIYYLKVENTEATVNGGLKAFGTMYQSTKTENLSNGKFSVTWDSYESIDYPFVELLAGTEETDSSMVGEYSYYGRVGDTKKYAEAGEAQQENIGYKTMYVINCNESITLRTSPSTKAEEILQIPLGAAVSYIEPSIDGFYKVSYMGNIGYALASYLSETPPADGENEMSDLDYAVLRVVNCNESITLRTSPSTSSAEICQMPLGSTVYYIESASNGFYKVSYMGNIGYALASYLTFE